MDEPNHQPNDQQMINLQIFSQVGIALVSWGIAWVFYKGGSSDTAPVVWPRCIAPGAVLLPIAPGIWSPSQSPAKNVDFELRKS
jgi:hypothetical protein